MKIQLLKQLASLLLAASPYGVIIVAVTHYSHTPLALPDSTQKGEDKKDDDSETKVNEINLIKQTDTSTGPLVEKPKSELEEAKSTLEEEKTTLQEELSTIQTKLDTLKTGGGGNSLKKVTQLEEKIQAIQSQLDNKTNEDKSLESLTDKKYLLIEAFWKQTDNLYELFSNVFKYANFCRVITSTRWSTDYTPYSGKPDSRLQFSLGEKIQFKSKHSTKPHWWTADFGNGSFKLWDTKGVRFEGVTYAVDFNWSPNITKILKNVPIGSPGYLWSYIGVKLEFTATGGNTGWIAIGVDNSDYQGVDDSGKTYTRNARADLMLHASRLGPQQNTIHRLLREYQEAVVKHNKLFNKTIEYPRYNIQTNGLLDWVSNSSENSVT